jgi:hypothetical protein
MSSDNKNPRQSDLYVAQRENEQLKIQLEELNAQIRGMMNGMPEVKYPNLDLPKETPDGRPHEVPRPDCEGHTTVLPDPTASQVEPPKEGVSRILIAIPLLSVSYEFFCSFLKFWTELNLNRDPRYEVGYHFAYRRPVHMAEEELVKVAQHNKCTHILFMDDDIYDVTKADLDKLLEADKDVIGGVMHASKFPHAQCVFRRYEPDKKVIDMPVDTSMYRLYEIPCLCTKCDFQLSHWDLKYCPNCGAEQDNLIQQADLIPFAFTLMKLSVFDKIKEPWFHCTNKYPTDSWFADRLIEAGMTEYAHMGIRLNHAGITDHTKPHYSQMGMIKTQQGKGVVHLSPQAMDVHQKLLYNKMRETEQRVKPRPTIVGQDGAVSKANNDSMTLVTKPSR